MKILRCKWESPARGYHDETALLSAKGDVTLGFVMRIGVRGYIGFLGTGAEKSIGKVFSSLRAAQLAVEQRLGIK